MKLSEAIRAGAKTGPQGSNMMFRVGDQRQLHTCALGAAALGAGVISEEDARAGKDSPYAQLSREFPILRQQRVKWPHQGDITVENAIMQLNDSRGWSREQIADWLEGHGQ